MGVSCLRLFVTVALMRMIMPFMVAVVMVFVTRGCMIMALVIIVGRSCCSGSGRAEGPGACCRSSNSGRGGGMIVVVIVAWFLPLSQMAH